MHDDLAGVSEQRGAVSELDQPHSMDRNGLLLHQARVPIRDGDPENTREAVSQQPEATRKKDTGSPRDDRNIPWPMSGIVRKRYRLEARKLQR